MGGKHKHRHWEKATKPLQCRVDEETRNQVETYAKNEKLSLAEAQRQLIEFGLETIK